MCPILLRVCCLSIWFPPVASRISKNRASPFLCPSMGPQFLLLVQSVYAGNVYVLKKWSDEWIPWHIGVLQGIPNGGGICWEGTEGRSAVSRTHSHFLRKHYQILLHVGKMMPSFSILDYNCHTGCPLCAQLIHQTKYRYYIKTK